jgi:hypothetical protein
LIFLFRALAGTCPATPVRARRDPFFAISSGVIAYGEFVGRI